MMPNRTPLFNTPQQEQEHWHVEKKIPLALIATILGGLIFHTATLGIWIMRTEARLDTLEKTDVATNKLIDARIQLNENRWSNLIRIEERQISTTQVIENIARKLDKIEERFQK